MEHCRSRRLQPKQGRLPELKENTVLQAAIFALLWVLIFAYSFLITYQSSGVLHAVQSNTEIIACDTALQEVSDFEASTSSVIINLSDGATINRDGIEFAFYENKGTDKVYFSSEDNMILMELADNYATRFLNGNSYFIVLVSVLITLVFLYAIRKRKWVVFSSRVVRVFWWIVTVFVTLPGLTAYIIF